MNGEDVQIIPVLKPQVFQGFQPGSSYLGVGPAVVDVQHGWMGELAGHRLGDGGQTADLRDEGIGRTG